MPTTDCHFCAAIASAPERWSSPLVVGLAEQHPHAEGHTVVVPRRHVARLTDLTEDEHRDLWTLARRVALDLDADHAPDAFTIGMNDGPAAGQSTPHVHLHVVPRHHGDMADPKGGIRRALPTPHRVT
jgi:diadenosine tetraphosphate (Ap4A) HIT family hydrolase